MNMQNKQQQLAERINALLRDQGIVFYGGGAFPRPDYSTQVRLVLPLPDITFDYNEKLDDAAILRRIAHSIHAVADRFALLTESKE